MSNETKSDKPRTELPPKEPIPVRVMKFSTQLDLPGKSFTASITSEPDKKGRASWWDLSYLPWMRHHKVTWHEGGEGKQPRTVFVHEANVASWEPL